ncbi:MAG: hypothetical protein AAF489_03695 [Bacteroidota bacterium]
MSNSLFLICPTDCLESTINQAFKHENYFYTSLGNSFDSDRKTLNSLMELIQNHGIRNICFVLSNDNRIILDALEGHSFSGFRGLELFYHEIMMQKRTSDISWQTTDHQFAVLSYYLNKRIKELRLLLYNSFLDSIEIYGQIYDRSTNAFVDIYSDLICIEKYSLN